ncbi:MAG: hypothetical protein IJF32_05855 [Oscillospiraceae bacterium]|nr:hypothetical protein [Oscillospiraceae bacterium]
MAIPKKAKKDYRTCEFCKTYPCMFTIRGEVEYKTHCRSYMANTKKIANDKMKKQPCSLMLQC